MNNVGKYNEKLFLQFLIVSVATKNVVQTKSTLLYQRIPFKNILIGVKITNKKLN